MEQLKRWFRVGDLQAGMPALPGTATPDQTASSQLERSNERRVIMISKAKSSISLTLIGGFTVATVILAGAGVRTLAQQTVQSRTVKPAGVSGELLDIL